MTYNRYLYKCRSQRVTRRWSTRLAQMDAAASDDGVVDAIRANFCHDLVAVATAVVAHQKSLTQQSLLQAETTTGNCPSRCGRND